ncbi:M15 family metallopeptidase [Parasedimentitalea huanghaiensis]|uniref:M15 family peptidase n=1 Tax=Parasedimentitalea huanghaiensis TaxID=2682100 RepID=A0A6L6WLE4_9RHOB|nr:M15 family metallopeptidase [Zongyanglinia huanghaiensis]MVO18676.1 M15 family peptidase [Zongyanglinia huanghaiensis]
MRVLPAIIIAVALMLLPGIWFALKWALSEEGFEGAAVDSTARIEIEMLRQQIEDLQGRLSELKSEVARLPIGGSGGAPATADADGERAIWDQTEGADLDYAQVVLIADRLNVNHGLRVAGGSYLSEKLGRPRPDLNDNCQPMTNPELKEKLVTTQVGPIRVSMLQPAITSLQVVFENIRSADPDLYSRINTAGALCVRRIRGTQNSLSTHSYGLAVDLNIDGQLDNFTDGKTQLGLTIIADFFNDEGWVWGAGFRREDSMHFEISRRQLDQWLAEGKL